MDLQVGTFTTQDGLGLHFEDWIASDFRGTILFIHGLGDRLARYRPFIEYFNKIGFRVCLYDQRGHGKSGGRPMDVKHFSQYLEDLHRFYEVCRQRVPSQNPYFLVGHSFGGQILLNFLAHHPGLFQAACSASANIETAIPIPKWIDFVGRKLNFLLPLLKLKGMDHPYFLTHDKTVVEDYLKDPLVHRFVTARLGGEIVKNQDSIMKLAPKIQTPLLMLHGSEDRYCAVRGTRRFFDALQLDQKQLKIYEGLYHELFHEIQKEEIFADVARWFHTFGTRPLPSGSGQEL